MLLLLLYAYNNGYCCSLQMSAIRLTLRSQDTVDDLHT